MSFDVFEFEHWAKYLYNYFVIKMWIVTKCTSHSRGQDMIPMNDTVLLLFCTHSMIHADPILVYLFIYLYPLLGIVLI